MRQTDWTLRLAEGVTLRLPLAGPVARFLAWSLDALVLGSLISLFSGLLSMLGLVAADLAQALALLAFFLAQTGYGIAMEWFWRGQTIGKRVFGLRVIDAQGCRLRLGQVVLRNLLRVIDALPLLYLVGGVATLVTRYSQRLGDLAAQTLVVRVRRHALPHLEPALDHQAPSLRSPAHLAARLRQKTAPDEAAALLKALARRDHLDPDARVALYAHIATTFRQRVPYPPDLTDGWTDEAYLRAVADVLFRVPHQG